MPYKFNVFTGKLDVVGDDTVSFESVNKNLKAWNYTLTYTGDKLTSISYTDGVDTIVKTLAYTGDQLTSVTLSGNTPGGINLVKTLVYTGPKLTSITYS